MKLSHHVTARRASLGILAAGAFLALPAFAQEATQEAAEAAPQFASAADTAFIFNTLLFLIGGFLVMWMAAGFAMLEAGMVRSKNVSMQLLKNISLYSIAGLMFWLVGYSLMYVDVNGYFGTLWPYSWPAAGTANEGDYSVASDWFFQMVFVATAASIVSGTLAERIKLWPFLIFVVVLTGFMYPITGSWKWGGGWLDGMGFQDFAGSTIVHSVGGWAALAGALLLGARKGKYGTGGEVQPIPGSNMALATLGTFILWLGWFGFNGASQLALGSNADASDISRIFANTNLAAAGGVVAALILTQLLYKKVDITFVLNGALAGLVSITAEPLTPGPFAAILIGAVGGVIVVLTVPLLDRFRIDDVVGAIPVHLLAGIWGTLVVPLTNADASFGAQIVGILAYGIFTFAVALAVWAILRATVGLRVSDEEEMNGLDVAEVGVEAYPEFIASRVR
ncbi:ammonium transporter [Aquibium sp. A9E412]|uniref:ammonium transporter n=1 Tax=Aquibium sp. A9E412 TaxID=2976767 RepID=UPI0025B11FAA|nr:ammonium transporter [Aquibium sp. A9E412]MDN2565725.1 ammonium transporter [Aquibium sp. A9E412]